MRARGLAALLALGALGACTSPPRPGQRLWEGSWATHHVGVHWVSGVSLDGQRRFPLPAAARLRAGLLNAGTAIAELTIQIDEGAVRRLPVDPGALLYLDEALRAGTTVALSGPATLILAEPRLVWPSDRAELLVVTLVDALRDDHATVEVMPAVLGHFAGGRRYTHAHANAPWTLPSLASAFTATPPLDLALPDGTLIAVPDGATTWAGALRAAGFSGGAVVANYSVHALNGFANGFDTYLVPDGHGTSTPPDAVWVVARAREWLAAHDGEPAFLYLHFMDVHEFYRDRHGLGGGQEMRPFAHRERFTSPEESAALRRLYLAAARHLDRTLAPLLASLPRRATTVLLADHGEALGEHGTWGHGLTVYEEALRVPMLLRGPRVPGGDVAQPAQLVDLAPTLLDTVGVTAPPSFPGRSLLGGGSALPLVAATFSAGPLRWSWLDGATKVTFHAAPWQAGPGAPPSPVLEGRPLASGAWTFDLARDPLELAPQRVEVARAFAAARALARTAGALAPGLHVLAVGQPGAARAEISTPTGLTPLHVFAPGPAVAWTAGTALEFRATEGYPFALAVFAGEPPARVALGPALPSWASAGAGASLPLLALGEVPEPASVGTYLFWRTRTTARQRGQEDTLSRLRNLGYLQ